jgi:flagellar basal-body rod modification protein FlgD
VLCIFVINSTNLRPCIRGGAKRGVQKNQNGPQQQDFFSMSTTAITAPSTVAVGDIVYAGASPNSGKTNLNQADFLKLLTAQLSAQDPMEPMKDTEFISQMANFTSLQNSQSLLESFKSFSSQQSLVSAPAYLGKYVTVKDPTLGPVSGLVESVSLVNGKPSLMINSKPFDISLVTDIASAAPTVTTAPTPPAV